VVLHPGPAFVRPAAVAASGGRTGEQVQGEPPEAGGVGRVDRVAGDAAAYAGLMGSRLIAVLEVPPGDTIHDTSVAVDVAPNGVVIKSFTALSFSHKRSRLR
jgi:hypothetical protein